MLKIGNTSGSATKCILAGDRSINLTSFESLGSDIVLVVFRIRKHLKKKINRDFIAGLLLGGISSLISFSTMLEIKMGK